MITLMTKVTGLYSNKHDISSGYAECSRERPLRRERDEHEQGPLVHSHQGKHALCWMSTNKAAEADGVHGHLLILRKYSTTRLHSGSSSHTYSYTSHYATVFHDQTPCPPTSSYIVRARKNLNKLELPALIT